MTLIALTISFPLGLGQFCGSNLTTDEQVSFHFFSSWLYLILKNMILVFIIYLLILRNFKFSDLFSNFTWTKDKFTIKEAEMVGHWATRNSNVFVSLFGYFLFYVSN